MVLVIASSESRKMSNLSNLFEVMEKKDISMLKQVEFLDADKLAEAE